MIGFATANVALTWLSHFIALSSIATAGYQWLTRFSSRKRVQKFFGASNITIVIPMRLLEKRRVIAEPDFVAASLLAEFLKAAKMDVTFDYVNPDGSIDLSTEGLVVICGPKKSSLVAKAMDHDPSLRFHESEGHWKISERQGSQEFQSLLDHGETESDTAYVARAPRRPGSRQTFVSIAGIHAQGSAIAVAHLTDKHKFKKLAQNVGGDLFSMVVSGDFSDETLRPNETHQLALYTHGPPQVHAPTGIISTKSSAQGPENE